MGLNLKKSAKKASKAVKKASKGGASKVAATAKKAKKKMGPAAKAAKKIPNKTKAAATKAAKKAQKSFSKAKSAAKKISKSPPKAKPAKVKTDSKGIANVAKKIGKAFSDLVEKAKVLCPKAPKPKPKVVNKRTPKNRRAGKKKPGDSKKRTDAAKAIWPGKQSYNNCGVMSSAQIIGQATGTSPDEDEITKKAINKGWASAGDADTPLSDEDTIPFKAGGTTPATRKSILADAGVKSTVSSYDRETLAQALWERKGVVASLHTDGASWWKNDDGTSRGSGQHAIVVTDGVYDKDGNLTAVVINDTGVGKQGHVVPIDDFEKATSAHKSPSLNITKEPIWP